LQPWNALCSQLVLAAAFSGIACTAVQSSERFLTAVQVCDVPAYVGARTMTVAHTSSLAVAVQQVVVLDIACYQGALSFYSCEDC
jgi:hypothetical protein